MLLTLSFKGSFGFFSTPKMIFKSAAFVSLVVSSLVTIITCPTHSTAIEFNEAFVKQPYFVDKSELLGEFFKNKLGPDYIYVSYPPKFGKTVNLQMIKRFCRVQLNFEKKPMNSTHTLSYDLFKNLKISRNRKVFSTHLARHPVIFLDLNFTIRGSVSEAQLVAGLNEQMKKCYSEYDWLIELAKKSKSYFYDETMDRALEGALGRHELATGLLHLARLLNEYFKIGVVLLVDNYDLILNALYVYEHRERMFLKPITRAMLKSVLTAEQRYVSHALIAGVSLWNYNLKDYENSTSTRERLMSVKTHSFLLDSPFAAYFGFTEPEMRTLCEQYKCTDDEKWLLKQLYDGYTNPTMFQSGLRSVYNPYSVIEFIAHRQTDVPFRNYWIRTQDTNFIYSFLRGLHFRKQFTELVKCEAVVVSPRGSIRSSYCTFDQCRTWYEPYNSSFLEYLFDCGYLTHDHVHSDRIRIPNDDIRQFLSSVLIQFYKENKYQIEKLTKCLDQMVLNPVAESENALVDFKVLLWSTLGVMNEKYGLQKNSTVNGSQDTYGFARVWLFKPEVIRLEVHNILMASALELHLGGKEILVARTSRKYPDQDHILLYDRNETLIVRINRQIPATPEVPSALSDALLPELGKMRVKILEIGISDQVRVEVEMRDYKDNRSVPLSDQKLAGNVRLQTLYPT